MAKIIRPIKGNENFFEVLEEIVEDSKDKNGEQSILYRLIRTGEILEKNNSENDEKPTEIEVKEFIGRSKPYGEFLHIIYNELKKLAKKNKKSCVYVSWAEKPHSKPPFKYFVRYF